MVVYLFQVNFEGCESLSLSPCTHLLVNTVAICTYISHYECNLSTFVESSLGMGDFLN
jgi:hypothetical protein